MTVRVTSTWLALLFLGRCVGLSAGEYGRTLEIAPVRLSQGDLMHLIDGLRTLAKTANSSFEPEHRGHETLDLAGGNITLSLGDSFSLGDFGRAPSASYSVRYSFARPEAPISRIDLELYDFERKLHVQGTA